MNFNGVKSIESLLKLAKEDKEVARGLKEARTLEELLKKAEGSDKVLILMRGISGSGKSHKANRIIEEMGGKVFSTDNYPGLYGDHDDSGIPSFNAEKIGEAHEWNKNMVRESMEHGVSPIVVDNTNTQSWEMRPYVEMAKKYGYSYKMENPDSPWWQRLFNKDMNPESKEELINELYSKTKHIPRPKNEGDRDPIRMMLDRWEHDPTEEDILKSKAPWEE